MFRDIIVYHKKRKMGNGNLVEYPVHKEYWFGEEYYAEINDRWIPSARALAEYRLLEPDYDRAIIYSFREEEHDNNRDDPYCCFYLTCMNTNPRKFKKHEYARYKKKGLSGVIFRNGVFKGQSTPYFNNFEIY
jgi:hypothetical protein